MPRYEVSQTFSNAGSKNEVRMKVVNEFAKEVPGKGRGDLATLYIYYVESLNCGNRVYLHRPARLYNGFDFVVCVEGYNFAAPEKRRRDYPTHNEIVQDLLLKKQESGSKFDALYNVLRQIYNCVDVSEEILCSIQFSQGLPTDVIAKTLKWLFIEQDIRYWNYSGRDMLWQAINGIVE